MSAKTVKLIYVNVDDGKTMQSNKFYNMTDKGDGTFLVEYGRVEKTCQTETYSISLWDKKHREKLKKGYVDVTHLFHEVAVKDASTGKAQSFSTISNHQVKVLIDTLQAYANKSIQQNYTVSADKVTQAQIDQAQKTITELVTSIKLGAKMSDVNKLLFSLYSTIPRQMKNVKDHILKADIKDQSGLKWIKEMLDDEQKTLDVMAGQVALNKAQQTALDPKAVKKTTTMLDAMGLEIEEITSAEEAMIKKMMGPNANQFKRAFKVKNNKTQKAFDARLAKAKDKKTELFWHGSRNENWFNIVDTGLLIRPSGAVHSGSMFGDGIYGANKAQKSIGYTSSRGSYFARGTANQAFLALFDFHVGKQKMIKHHNSDCYSLNEKKLAADGFDSVYAQGGADLRNDEFIVYNAAATTIKYIIEFTS